MQHQTPSHPVALSLQRQSFRSLLCPFCFALQLRFCVSGKHFARCPRLLLTSAQPDSPECYFSQIKLFFFPSCKINIDWRVSLGEQHTLPVKGTSKEPHETEEQTTANPLDTSSPSHLCEQGKITSEETPAGSWLLSQHTLQHTECCFTF